MTSFTISVVLQVALLAQITNTCLIKAKQPSAKELKFHGPWNDESFKRNFGSCECGQKISSGQVPPWNLFIFGGNKICLGTIVTSNLVATSHRCVRRRDDLHIYDAWNISSEYKSFANPDEITVTVSNMSGETFPVLELIPNPQFLMSWKTKSEKLGYDSLDLLLIMVKADFTTHKELRPICIYEDADDLDFVGQMGYYYAHQSVVPEESIPNQVYEGKILTRKGCYLDETGVQTSTQEDKHDALSGLCLRWTTPSQSARHIEDGGALILKSKSKFSFLAGITSNFISRGIQESVTTAYVSNIIPMIKYLEYRAHQSHSTWCRIPSTEIDRRRDLSKGRSGLWPWEEESAQTTFKLRNTSLDCVCGVPNNELSGRIAGGVEATPYEFGWMAALNLYPNGKAGSKGYSICGGAITNDRMILTAAHCLVNDHGRETSPENIDVFLSIHKRYGHAKSLAKEVDLVLVHPAFAEARKNGYFDYDIALLVLKEELEFPPLPEEPESEPTPHLRPICLPKMGEVMKLMGEQVMVSGWGLTNPDDNKSAADKMQKIELPIIPLQGCRDTAGSKVTDHFLCAGSLDKFKDAASGDSGGPLSIMRGRQWTEVGIVSWGEDSFKDGRYHRTAALYTDVTDRVILPFIDYFAKKLRVRWCSSEIPD